jgi:hypothetical protein
MKLVEISVSMTSSAMRSAGVRRQHVKGQFVDYVCRKAFVHRRLANFPISLGRQSWQFGREAGWPSHGRPLVPEKLYGLFAAEHHPVHYLCVVRHTAQAHYEGPNSPGFRWEQLRKKVKDNRLPFAIADVEPFGLQKASRNPKT